MKKECLMNEIDVTECDFQMKREMIMTVKL